MSEQSFAGSTPPEAIACEVPDAPADATETVVKVDCTSDERTINNVIGHEYRVLSHTEKVAMKKIKDMGLELHEYIAKIGSSRELSVAKTKIEEAVMWAVKHITG